MNESNDLPVVATSTNPSPAPDEGVLQNVTPCNIWQTAIPGLDPEDLQHKSLSPKQMAGLHLVLRGQSDLQISRQLGVSRQTVYRWRVRDLDFQIELARHRETMFRRSEDRLRSMLEPAIGILERHITDAELMEKRPELAVRVAGVVAKLALRRPPEPAVTCAAARAKRQKEDFENAARRRLAARGINLPPASG